MKDLFSLKKIILFVAQGGKNNPFKGGEYFDYLATSKKLPKDTLLICIGKEMKSHSQELGVMYLPYINDQKKLSQYFSASDVFLFTSQAENCPLVLLEALSSGTPVLGFPVGGVPEIIEHKKNGYLSKINNKVDLLKGANYLLSMKNKEVYLMRKYNRKKALKYFSIERMVNSYKKIYAEI